MRFLSFYFPNRWDIFFLSLFLFLLYLCIISLKDMFVPYTTDVVIDIDLSFKSIPLYTVKTIFRMFVAFLFSLFFSFLFGTLAAKNNFAEKIIIPFVDIMQSIPVLGFLSFSIVFFMMIFPNKFLGLECAAIFAIFTSQVWNMILSFYQSLITIPKELVETSFVYKLSFLQRFLKLELPYSIPNLIWNSMMSVSAGWFFIVLSESIFFSNNHIVLPGLGSYIGKAILEANFFAILYALFVMFFVIFLYDQLFFRPILVWSEKFNFSSNYNEILYTSWFYDLFNKCKLLKNINLYFILNIFFLLFKLIIFFENMINIPLFLKNINYYKFIFITILFLLLIYIFFSFKNIDFFEILNVFYLCGLTGIKVIFLVIIASFIWVPIGIYIGLNKKLSGFIQPVIQFLAAFPANFFYPLVIILILNYKLNHNIWTMPLMILGTQWYILFNVISGTNNISSDLYFAGLNFGLSGFNLWKRLLLPSIFPSYVTGVMSAAGGCWNASIVAEFVQWGNDTIITIGIGSYISNYTMIGDFNRIFLGIFVMCLYVLLLNRFVWKKLYNFSKNKFSFG